jgi:flagellar basal body P-ring formation protein FlgA
MESLSAPPAPARLARAVGRGLLILLALAWCGQETRADDGLASTPATGLDPGLEQQVRTLALGAAGAAPAGVTRVEVSIGQLDPRLHLAACQRVEPYLPTGTRLWGRARIGLRCVQGPTAWNVFLPITVRAYGRALVTTVAAPSGSVLKAGDLAQAEVDLAEDSTAALVDAESAVGRTLAQSLKPGQSVRQGHLKPRQWFAAGDTIKITALGAGFSLEGEGQALSNGVEGLPARVRIEGGRVLTGQPVGERRLELAL